MEKNFNKVLCLGLSRTGTSSLSEALNSLGLKTIHYPLALFVNQQYLSSELAFQPQISLKGYWKWYRNKQLMSIKKAFDLEHFLTYDAYADLPIPLFFKELDILFPGSKFIYTYREEQKWLASMQWMLEKGIKLWKHGYLEEELNLQMYECKSFKPDTLINAYRKHHSQVKNYFKNRPGDVLCINIDQQPLEYALLCEFLGLRTPETAFPKSNQAVHKSNRIKEIDYLLLRNVPFYAQFKHRIKQFGIK